MKQNKLLNKLSLFIIILFILNLSITPIQAQDTSIPFMDMEIQPDNVDNYGGVRVVVFFSHNCLVCKDEVDTLKEIDTNYNVRIIMLNYFQASDNETIVDFIDDTDALDHWTYGFLTNDAINEFNIESVPTMIILDDLGRIVADMLGAVSYKYLETLVTNAIDQKTDEYFTDRREDAGGYADVIFIVVGVIISAVVVYFLVQSFTFKKKEEKS